METKKTTITDKDEELVEKLEELLALAKEGRVAQCSIQAIGLKPADDDDDDDDETPEEIRKKIDMDGDEFITRLKKMEYGTKMVMKIKDFEPLPEGLVNAYNKLCKE